MTTKGWTGDNTWRLKIWSPEWTYEYSHYAILDKINPDTDSVVDVGCGTNMFHGKIKHLVAFDPTPCSDDSIAPYIISTLENFETTEKFDVALCLGSIQFGTDDDMIRQIEKINGMLKPSCKVFWRFRLEDDSPEKYLYNWTLSRLQEFADQYGFTQQEEHVDTNIKGVLPRQYVEWVR